jgi:dolichol-phosphate mannosyltransferase
VLHFTAQIAGNGTGIQRGTFPLRHITSAPNALTMYSCRVAAPQLSIVIPIYNEEELLSELLSRIGAVKAQLHQHWGLPDRGIEVLFVNDGSTDDTRAILKAHCQTRPDYVLINLSRNHGHQLAITAGLDHAGGDAVVMIDGDLQDPPEMIIDLYRKHREGYDVVYAVRNTRPGETWFKLTTASLFYKTLRHLTGVDIPADTGDFRIISRRVADSLRAIRERHRFIRGLVSWVGFRQTGIVYDRQPRFAGHTKYPLSKMIRFAIDGITSFSSVPLRFISYVGLFTALLGFVAAAYVLYLRLFTDRTIQGWTSLIIIVLLVGGVQLIALGVIGEYLGRLHDESKSRPLYIIESIYSGSQSHQERT